MQTYSRQFSFAAQPQNSRNQEIKPTLLLLRLSWTSWVFLIAFSVIFLNMPFGKQCGCSHFNNTFLFTTWSLQKGSGGFREMENSWGSFPGRWGWLGKAVVVLSGCSCGCWIGEESSVLREWCRVNASQTRNTLQTHRMCPLDCIYLSILVTFPRSLGFTALKSLMQAFRYDFPESCRLSSLIVAATEWGKQALCTSIFTSMHMYEQWLNRLELLSPRKEENQTLRIWEQPVKSEMTEATNGGG